MVPSVRASSTMNTTDRFVRFAAEGEVMAKFSRQSAKGLAQRSALVLPERQDFEIARP